MFNESSQTPYDVRFTLFGIPVRIHPFFWLVSVFMGLNLGESENGTQRILCWVVAVFIAILVHELGHALIIRYIFGASPWIILYSFGGLACHHPQYSRKRPGTWGQILISLGGPLAGFLLAGLCYFLLRYMIPGGDSNLYYLLEILYFICFIGFFWGFINLLPVYPLDGGQICRELCLWFSPWQGDIVALRISFVAALGVVVLCLTRFQGNYYIAILFGILAYENYQSMTRGSWR
ncbi:MAG: site-2 protease family protein [Planctomycetaceae bacterium]|jgi:Zn-dependent protease|nr:site-2 protease family protein [Planctomycetaceae bacterium]